MEKVDTLVVDKTGTLTEGRPKVVAVVATEGTDENELLRFAASVERASEHPLAQAIVSAASDRKIALAEVADFESPTEKGALGLVDGKRVALGNVKFLKELEISTASLEDQAKGLRQDGATAIYVGIDGNEAGIIAIADPVKNPPCPR